MAVDVGTAKGYLDLDISGFLKGLKSAQTEADTASKNIATKLGNNLSSAGQKLESAGKSLTKSVTVPIVGIGATVVKMSTDFESSMSKVQAISGATGSDLEKLNKKAQEMGAKTKFSATEAADAFTYMAMAGWKTEDMLDGIDGIMNLAAADGLDLATTSDIVTDALTAFGLSASDSAHFADILAKASSSANTNVSMLGESFKYVAPVAGALGYSAEDTAIALGLMANAGIKGSQGGTALRSALTRLIKPTDDAAGLMEKYGLSMTNSDGSMKSLSEVMVMLRSKFGDLTEAEQSQVAATLFGQEAMSGMLSIINASDKDFKSLTDQIYNADGAAKKMADTMLNNLKGQLTILKSALEGLALQFGEIILPHLKSLVDRIQKVVEKLQSLSPEQKEQIVKWAAIAAAIGPVLVILGKVVSSVGGMITTFGKIPGAVSKVKSGFTALGTGIKNVGEGFKLAKAGFSGLATQAGGFGTKMGAALAGVSGPMIAIVAVIAVLIAAFVSLWKNNEEFRDKVTGIWNQIKETFNNFTKGIVDRLNSLGFNFESITDVLKAIWDGFCNFLAPIFEGVFQHIANVFKTITDVILGIMDFFISVFKGDWDGAWNAIKGIFESIWNGIKEYFSNVLNTIKGIFDVVLGWFGTSWDECWNSIKTFFVDTWNSIVSWFKNALEDIKTFFSDIWNGISSFFTNVWEDIKNVVKFGIMFIGSILDAAFKIITLPFRLIWENCKDTIIPIWETIKETVSNALEKIKEFISKVWNSIKAFLEPILTAISDFVSKVWNGIKDTISSVVNTIKTTVSNVFNAVKEFVSNVFNSIKNTVTVIWNKIKDAISGPINTAKNTVSNAINSIKDTISSKFNAAKNVVVNVFDSIKNKIKNTFETAKSTVSNAINKIKSMFNFKWSFPKLKLPHFSIKGKFSLDPPSVPKLQIDWYAKAMGSGMILNSPTIFGYNSKTGKLLGGGEAGSETIVGTKSLLKMIKEAVSSSIKPIVDVSYKLARASYELGYVTYNGFVKQGEVLNKFIGSSNAGGGDTYNFYSPKAIDEIEAAKQMKKTKRELAEGF